MARMGEASERPWVRWLLMGLFVLALSITFINLGQWQLNRLDQRRERNAAVVAHENAAVTPYEQIFTREITEDDQWQRVTVTGTFDAEHQLIARYRSNLAVTNETGWELITPLNAADGRIVLIDRGFVAKPGGQDYPTTLPAPPAGEVTVIGYVRRNEVGKPNATNPQDGNNIRLINSDAIAAWYGKPLVNGYISLLEVTPAQTGELKPVSPPPLDEGPHLSYALQWFSFTIIAGVGLVLLIRNDIRDRKKRAAKAAEGGFDSGAARLRSTNDDSGAAHLRSTDDDSGAAHLRSTNDSPDA